MNKGLKKTRETNFELLRIVSMLGIVLIHCLQHGVVNPNSIDEGNANFLVYELFGFIGRFGVICLVMVTGYFMVQRQINLRSLTGLILKTVFYSVVIFLIVGVFDKTIFDAKHLLKSFLPITFRSYWFITCYIVLYLLIPFINLTIKMLNKRQYRVLLIVLSVIFSILPCFTGQSWLDTTDFVHGCVLFVFVYLLAGYLRLYPEKIFNNKKIALTMVVLSQTTIWIFILAMCYIFNRPTSAQYLTVNFSPFIILESLGVFIIFKGLKIKNNNLINWVASSTLAVYLIHENPILYRILWGNVFNIQAQFEGGSMQFVFTTVGSVLIVFCMCVVVDKIVEGIFLNRIIGKIYSILEKTKMYAYTKDVMNL